MDNTITIGTFFTESAYAWLRQMGIGKPLPFAREKMKTLSHFAHSTEPLLLRKRSGSRAKWHSHEKTTFTGGLFMAPASGRTSQLLNSLI